MRSKDSDKWTGENVNEKNSFDKYKIVTIMKLEDLQKDVIVLITTLTVK